jgi:hypothetical protein
MCAKPPMRQQGARMIRQVLECGSALPLFFEASVANFVRRSGFGLSRELGEE